MRAVTRFPLRTAGVLAALTTLAAACATAPRLKPAPRANGTPGAGLGAVATQAGVTVEARPRMLGSHNPVLTALSALVAASGHRARGGGPVRA